MKALLLFILFPFYVNAQDTVISYSEIVTVDSASKNDLFIKARQWVNETFKSSKDVLQINDKETGELSGKGIMPVIVHMKYLGDRTYTFEANFAINIWVKDGRYKYEFKNFNVYFPDSHDESLGILTSSEECPTKFGFNSQKKTNEIWQSAKKGTDYQAKIIIASLKVAMQKKKSDSDF